MGISWAAYIQSWAIWAMYFIPKRATERQLLKRIKQVYQTANGPQPVPKFIKDDEKLSTRIATFKSGSHEWETIYVKPAQNQGKIVMIYQHGGAWFSPITDYHYKVVKSMVETHNMEVVVANYKMIPLAHATVWEQVAVDLACSLAKNYPDKKFSLAGDSAGGWTSLRLVEALAECALNSEDSEKGKLAGDFLHRLVTTILISPATNLAVTPAVERTALVDPWLFVNLLKVVGPLWAYGPSAFPDFDFGLKPGQGAPSIDSTSLSINEARFSPNKGLGVLKEFRAKFPSSKPFSFITSIGTHDICHPATMDMHNSALELGSNVVESEMFEEEGLFHVYALLPNPEAKRFWKRVNAKLTKA